KLELYFGIVRLQLCEFLEQRVGLNDLSLVEINDAQLTQCRRIFRSKSKHPAIVRLSFVPLPCGKSCIGAGHKLIFGGFGFGAAREGSQAECEKQPRASATYGSMVGRHGSGADWKDGAGHGRAARSARVLFQVGVEFDPIARKRLRS